MTQAQGGSLLVGRLGREVSVSGKGGTRAAQFNPSFLPPTPLSLSHFSLFFFFALLPPFPHIPLPAPWLVDHYADRGRGNPAVP